jgi:hypothetical protein
VELSNFQIIGTKLLFIGFLIVSSVSGYCQNTTDSSYENVQKSLLDSSEITPEISPIKNNILAKGDSVIINFKSEMTKLDDSLNFDSTQKHKLKNQASEISKKFKIRPPDSASFAEKKSQFLDSIKNSKLNPSLYGSIVSESYATNYQDPYTRSEAIYTRLYGSPSIEMLGLPFNINFFYTSEDNSIYNSNYISLDFDINRYRQNLKQKLEEKINAQVEAKRQLATELFDVSKSDQSLKRKLEQEKSKLREYTEKIKSPDVSNEISNLADAQINKQEEKFKSLQDSFDLDNLTDSQKQRLESKKSSIQDSLNAKNTNYLTKQQEIQDSVSKVQERIERYQEKIELIQKKHAELEDLDKKLQDSLGTLRKQYTSQSFLTSKVTKHPFGAKVMKLVSKVDKFQVGLTNPMFSEYTLNGIPVKGMHTSIDFGSKNVELAIGKTFRSEYNTFGLSQPKPVFDRNVIGIKTAFEFGIKNKKSITLTSLSLFDDEVAESRKQNILHALDYNTALGPKLDFYFSLNHSILKQETIENATLSFENDQELKLNQFQGFLDHFAYEGGLEYQASKNLSLESSYKRISPEYLSLGNPFLRSNFHELDVKIKSKFFKRKITLTSFYKKFEDNITNLSESTNQMSGYGIAIRSNFRKPLNFHIQHSPYQQGNNNPDTLFRTDNQLAVTSANLIYNKVLKTGVFTSILTYVRSTIDYNKGELLVNNSMYLLSTNWSNKKINCSSNISRNLTGPTVDTLNFTGVRFGIAQKDGKKVNYAISTFYDRFDYGGVRHLTTVQARFKLLPKLESTLSGEFGQIKDLYEIDQKEVFGFRVLLKYMLQ